VDDRATPALARIRKKIGLLEDRIKSKLDSIMASPVYGKYLQDHFVTVRDGRYVLPLKSEYRSSLEGSIERRVGRPLCVVLVGDWCAEQRHDPVAEELVHRPLITVNFRQHQLEGAVHEGVDVLRVQSLRQ
jgi:hypothetical protein